MDLKIYDQTIQVRYRRMPVDLYHLSSQNQIRKWMKTYFPLATTSMHKQLRDEAYTKERALQHEWLQTTDKAFRKIFKRPMHPNDYKVAWVGRHEFSPRVKIKLRQLVSEEKQFTAIRNAHDLMLPNRFRLHKI
jgi:hypothetical protein